MLRDITKKLCGIFALSVVLFSSSAEATRLPMQFGDLDHFVPRCDMKYEQMQFLSAMKPTPQEVDSAKIQIAMGGAFLAIFNPSRYNTLYLMSTGEYGWLIDQHLWELQNNCP